MNRDEITDKVKGSFALMHGHLSSGCLNDYFIMDREFCLCRGDFKIMREHVNDEFNVVIPHKKFENASISDIVNIIDKKMKDI